MLKRCLYSVLKALTADGYFSFKFLRKDFKKYFFRNKLKHHMCNRKVRFSSLVMWPRTSST